MVAVNETAYPPLKSHPTAKELMSIYSPNPEELAFGARVATRPITRVSLLLLLKTFQRLGYFPMVSDIPSTIV